MKWENLIINMLNKFEWVVVNDINKDLFEELKNNLIDNLSIHFDISKIDDMEINGIINNVEKDFECDFKVFLKKSGNDIIIDRIEVISI